MGLFAEIARQRRIDQAEQAASTVAAYAGCGPAGLARGLLPRPTRRIALFLYASAMFRPVLMVSAHAGRSPCYEGEP
jgi:hypothetical protein